MQRGAKNLHRNLGGKKREKGRKEQNYKLSEMKMTRGKLKKSIFSTAFHYFSVVLLCFTRIENLKKKISDFIGSLDVCRFSY